MFEEFKAKRAAAQAAKTQQTALAKAQQELNDWQKQVDSVQALIATAQADGAPINITSAIANNACEFIDSSAGIVS